MTDQKCCDLQLWPLTRILTEVRCGSQDWTWEEEWANLDRRHAETGYLTTLEQQIRENGITMPVLIGSDGRLWDGHHRLRLAVRIGIDYVPVEVVATVRDAARTAAARQATPHACDNCDGIDPASCLNNPDRAARQTTEQDDTHPGYDIAGYPEKHAGPREKCPDPACETDQHATCGAECPAVGQPAEAQATNEAVARVQAWIASDPVTARSEFGNGYREALRDITDVINRRQTGKDER